MLPVDGYFDDGYWTIGGTQSPLTTSLTNSLLLDANPSLYYMCQYYQGVIDLDLQPRWNACITGAGLSGLYVFGYRTLNLFKSVPLRVLRTVST